MLLKGGLLEALGNAGHQCPSGKVEAINFSYCWDYTKTGLKSGFGILAVCMYKKVGGHESGNRRQAKRQYKVGFSGLV